MGIFHRKKWLFLLIVVLLAFMVFACSLSRDNSDPAIYVCAQTGDDQKGDGTKGSPWKTIVKGAEELGRDENSRILVIRGGDYPVSGEIQLRRSGSAGKPLIIRSAPGETVNISNEWNGSDNLASRFIFNIKRNNSHKGLEYITIKGVHFTGGVTIGGSDQSCSNIHIEECTFTAHGANLGPNNPTLINLRRSENCSIKSCVLFCDDPQQNDFSGIKIWKGTKKLVIDSNEIYGLARKGIDNKHGMPDQALVIRNNYIHHLSDRAINVNADRTIIENNVIYRCPAGINVWKESGAPGGSFSIISHNTIVSCDIGIMLEPESSGKLHDCRVINNLLVNCGGSGFAALNISPYRREPYEHGHYSDYNCFYNNAEKRHVRDRDDTIYGLQEWQKVSGLDGHSVERDPGFMQQGGMISKLCGFRASDNFISAEETRGDDGLAMGANIVPISGGCRIVVQRGGNPEEPFVASKKIYTEPGTIENNDRPRPPQNIRVNNERSDSVGAE